ncbi:nucleoside phosphorylase domain-containing protein [Xylaria sp. FL0064]|nr:nucleoside phosphorylase domain-containing protein [Xylaria sp. FL0064]
MVNDYTVGWICALHIEMAAAKCMLHNVHEGLGKSSDDSNTYIFGSICGHNIVIACLPAVGYGTNNAAIVASHMRRTFPSIRTFLMVGIGGGAPGRVDIRLGDVVVSTGVIQYDMGKTIQQGQFRATGVTRQPSPTLMTAVSAIRAHHEIAASKIPFILSRMREQYPSMGEYTDRESLQDFLFDSAYDHPATLESCADCDRSRLVRRPSRSNNNPVLHYGIIASGNQVMKHARTRDRVAEEFDAICFEMEAAGLMDSFQCLVIRGICDYSDSHKNKEWQKYASATAAAYTKELLGIIPTIEIETASNGTYAL